MMLRNLSLCILVVFSAQGCGGGGGGGGSTNQNSVGTSTTSSTSSTSTSSSSSGSSSSTTTYTYDKVATDEVYANKTWDSVTIGRFLDTDQGYLTDYSDDIVTILTAQNGTSIDIEISGTKRYDETAVNHSWTLNEANSTTTFLYDPSNPSSTIAAVIAQSFANVDIGFLTYYLDYLAGQNIMYTDLAFTEITWKDGTRNDSFVTAYGDATETGDLPSSGSKSYNIEVDLMMEYWTDGGITRNRILASGDGQLSVNFSSDTVTGSIDLDSYYDWDLWLQGGTDISQIFGLDNLTLDISNGTLSGGNFVSTISVDHDSSDGTDLVGVGSMQGTLFGPDGDEVGVAFYMLEDDSNDTQDVYWWDLFGGAIGQ